jgi:hypothetical protein
MTLLCSPRVTHKGWRENRLVAARQGLAQRSAWPCDRSRLLAKSHSWQLQSLRAFGADDGNPNLHAFGVDDAVFVSLLFKTLFSAWVGFPERKWVISR